MCGRFTQQRPTSDWARIFEAELLVDDPGGHFNLAPTDPAAVVVERRNRRAVTAYRWGLVPTWAPDTTTASRFINARAETVLTTPAYRDAFRRHRCLVPADAFYEWERTDGVRQPYLIRREDLDPMALAGLWSFWRDPKSGEPLRSFSIVTTTANSVVAPIHGRMPVIVPTEGWSTWLDPALVDAEELRDLLRPAPADGLIAYPVVRLVNNVRNNGPELLAPFDLATTAR